MVRTLVGTRIRERRRARGQTQIALARAVGISASYLNLIEHNKRGIAGRTLLALARELGLQPADLSDAGDEETLTRLLEAARDKDDAGAELDRIEEFVGRYPGWARLLTAYADTARGQTERLRALSDRMGQDPFLSETMHEILSNITAIRSTSDILAGGDVPPDVQARFLANLAKDAERLSDAASRMVEFFDSENSAAPVPDRPAQSWPPVADPVTATGPQEAGILAGGAARLAHLSESLPTESFARRARELAFDPLRLADAFSVEPWDICLRLADMPAEDDFPKFGLIECDMSGAVLTRKPLPALAPPQYSSGCPLWPVYRAFARPRQVLRAILDMPSGDRLMTYAVAHADRYGDYTLPPMLRSVMVFSDDPAVFPSTREARTTVLAGVHCSVCPRKICADRRTDYILA